MKKLLLVSTLLGLIVLGGCATTPTIPTNTLSQDELFQKKLECAKHKESIEQGYKDTAKNGINCFLDDIFYSENLNTCISAETCLTSLDENRNSNMRLLINDTLSNKKIFELYIQDINGKGTSYIEEEKNKRLLKIQKLKGE